MGEEGSRGGVAPSQTPSPWHKMQWQIHQVQARCITPQVIRTTDHPPSETKPDAGEDTTTPEPAYTRPRGRTTTTTPTPAAPGGHGRPQNDCTETAPTPTSKADPGRKTTTTQTAYTQQTPAPPAQIKPGNPPHPRRLQHPDACGSTHGEVHGASAERCPHVNSYTALAAQYGRRLHYCCKGSIDLPTSTPQCLRECGPEGWLYGNKVFLID